MRLAALILIIFGHFLTEVPNLLPHLGYGYLNTLYIQPFINYHYPGPDGGINAAWFLKYAAEDLLWICYSAAVCLIAFRCDRVVFIASVNWFLYHVVDGFMFYWNFKRSHWLEWFLLAIIIFSILVAVRSKPKLKPV